MAMEVYGHESHGRFGPGEIRTMEEGYLKSGEARVLGVAAEEDSSDQG